MNVATASPCMPGILPGAHAELWGWLQAQAMAALLAVCVARCANIADHARCEMGLLDIWFCVGSDTCRSFYLI